MATVSSLVSSLRVALGPLLRVYVQERFLAGDVGGQIFTSWETRWYQRPPAVIRVNGAVQRTGYTVNYYDGTVQFNSPVDSTSVVTAEFYFSPLTDEDLDSFLQDGLRELATHLAINIDPTIDLDFRYEAPVRNFAYCAAVRSIALNAADYHLFEMDGVRIDKSQVSAAYNRIVISRYNQTLEMVARLEMDGLGNGRQVNDQVITG